MNERGYAGIPDDIPEPFMRYYHEHRRQTEADIKKTPHPPQKTAGHRDILFITLVLMLFLSDEAE